VVELLSESRRLGAAWRRRAAEPVSRTKKARSGPGADLGSAQNAYIVRLSMDWIRARARRMALRTGDG
jgi:hypothetical protein